MNISERLIEITAGVREQAGPYAAKASTLARQFGARLLEQQSSMVKGMVHEGNERLRLFAKASDMHSALNQQYKYFAVTRERLSRDARGTYGILAEAGREIGQLAVEGYQKVTCKAPAPRRSAAKAPRKAPVKTASRAKQSAKSRARKAA